MFIPDNSLGLFPGIRRDLVAPFRSLVPFFVIGRPALQEIHKPSVNLLFLNLKASGIQQM